MKFIFPKNYNFKPKLLGFIEYSTAIFDIILGFFLYKFVNYFFTNINIKIYVFISLFFPIFLISILGINKESFLSIFKYLFKFIKNQNIYLYKKNSYIEDEKNTFFKVKFKKKLTLKSKLNNFL